ncbi:LysM peptidoglycan-binding domain-containing protein [Bacillus salitolerans]|uniref:LysM peptidoglycan-binding domain-containing protein n=1 Tax=Bacillus salitolerans TaxID=1437434 RepID=A0ABW4LPF9_9BACI
MKKLTLFLIISLLIYSVYYDLKTGTLPISKVIAASGDNEINTHTPIPTEHFIEVKVKPGDTVLSILEQHLEGNLPVSIPTVIIDFKKLNDEMDPEKIQIGKTYKIPLYKK